MTKLYFFYNAWCIEADELSECTFIPGEGVIMPSGLNLEQIELKGVAGCTVSSAKEDKSTIYTAKLTLPLRCDMDTSHRRLCYILETASGEKFLLGTSEHPYPVTNKTETYGETYSANAGIELQVEYRSTEGLWKIII